MRAEPRKRPFSLRWRVAWWLIPPMTILLIVNAVWSYKVAVDAANRAYDRSMSASMKAIAENIHSTGGRISADIPYSALDIFAEGVQERVYYAVIGPDGSRLTGYEDLLPPPMQIRVDEPTMVDTVFRQQAVRLGALSKRLYDPELPGGDMVTILFAETTEARTGLAFTLFTGSLKRQATLIAVGALLVMLALTSAFRPLVKLRNTIRERHAEDLTPVPRNDVPSELVPLIDAIDHHMSRLGRMLQARRRFLADAAHQIRTPLTVLGTQAEYGRRQSDVEEMRKTFDSQVASVRGARRMVNQMLTLARAEPANGQVVERVAVDLGALVHDVATELAAVAMKKGVEIAYEASAAPAVIMGDATMLREMVTNLADNALRYTPSGGHVLLAVEAADGEVVLRVVDDGPGIPEAERERVFHRFYRILGQSDSEGSGLGLAIVREICWAHGGRIELGEGVGGRGLSVRVSLGGTPT